MAKRLNLKVRKFWGPNPTFAEVTGEKLEGGAFCPPPILNRGKDKNNQGIVLDDLEKLKSYVITR